MKYVAHGESNTWDLLFYRCFLDKIVKDEMKVFEYIF